MLGRNSAPDFLESSSSFEAYFVLILYKMRITMPAETLGRVPETVCYCVQFLVSLTSQV